MKDYKILTDIDLSSNSLYNISKIIGNEYSNVNNKRVSINRSFRDLLITTCDLSNEEAGNTLIRAGISDTPGYVHIWAGVKEEPTVGTENTELIDGILIKPDNNIILSSSTSNILLKSRIDSSINSEGTINFKIGESTTTQYNSTSITTTTDDYNLTTKNVKLINKNNLTLDNENLITITSNDYSIKSDRVESGDNYKESNKFILDVSNSSSKITLKDLYSFGTSDLLHTNISGNINIGNIYTAGVEGTEKYDRNLTAKGNISDIEYRGNIWYVKDHSTDVFRLVAFGDSKPVIEGESVSSESNFSKLTIQYVDILKDLVSKGAVTLGASDKDVTITSDNLTINSNVTNETHGTLDVKAGTGDIYRLSVTADKSTLDIDNIKVHESLIIDKERGAGAGTLTVTGTSTFKDDISLTENADVITVDNTSKQLTIKSDVFEITDLTDVSFFKLEKTTKKGTISLNNLDFKSSTGDLQLLSGSNLGDVEALVADEGKSSKVNRSTPLKGDSLIKVDSAVINNENVTTSNIKTLNLLDQLNVDGHVKVDSKDIVINSLAEFVLTSEESFSETHNGTYKVEASTYAVNVQSGNSTVTADKFVASEDITSEGTLNIGGESTFKGLISAAGNIELTGSNNNIYSSFPINIKSDNFTITSNTTSESSIKYDLVNGESTTTIKTDNFYLKRGLSENNILSYDGTSAVLNVDNINATRSTLTGVSVTEDLNVAGKLHGSANIEFTNTLTTLTSSDINVTSTRLATLIYKEFNLDAGTGGDPGTLVIKADETSSSINVDNITVDDRASLSGSTTIGGTLDLNATSNISGDITLGNSNGNNIVADSGINLKVDPLNITSGTNNITLSKDGLTETLNELHVNVGTGKLLIDADSEKSSITVTEINTETQSIDKGTITDLTSTTANITSRLTVGGSTFNSSTTDSILIGRTLTIKGGSTDNTNYNFVLDAKPSESTLKFKGNTTLTGTLSVSDSITVPTINSDKDLSLNAINTNISSFSDTSITTSSFTVEGIAATIKYGAKNSEAYQLIVTEDNTSTLTSTNLNSTTFVNSGLSTTENLKVNNTANFNNFTIYWDNTINSLVFAKGNL